MKPVVFVGSDEETYRHLSRRLRTVPLERDGSFEEVALPDRELGAAVLVLDSDFPSPFVHAAEALAAREVPFVVVSTVETMKAAVHAMRLGAYDYFLASEDRDAVADAVLRVLENRRLPCADSGAGAHDLEDVIVGRSQKIQELFKLIGKIASSSVSVLLRGESGTGKELVARQIHANSQRRKFPFVVIDCAAIPRDLVENELFGHEVGAYSGAGARTTGKFDLANNGTIFLDEISELDLDLQSKILRVIQQGTFDRVGGSRSFHVDVRTIATTQMNLEDEVRQGRFRQDLYHRLNVIALYLPPLRERAEDIPILVQHFVRKHGHALGFPEKTVSSSLMARFEKYSWPGNVRELENIVRRALLLERGSVLTPRFLEEFPVPGEGPIEEDDLALDRLISERFVTEDLNWKRNDVYRQMTARVEHLLLRLALEKTRGNQVSASRFLGISRNTLRVKMGELGLDSAEFR